MGLRMKSLNWMSCATSALNKKQAVTTTQLAVGKLKKHRGVEPTEANTNNRLTLAIATSSSAVHLQLLQVTLDAKCAI